MKLIGYRFKNHEEENWAYTYDLDKVSHGKGIKEYGYVEPIYVDDEQNYVQVEIPKVPRWVADILTQSQTRGYSEFKHSVVTKFYDGGRNHKNLKKYLENHDRKNIDLAIVLGVWGIED